MTDSNGQHDAHVQVLTAEVRALVVGSRQVTLSVYRQLDWVQPYALDAFGRVRAGSDWDNGSHYVRVVGRGKDDVALVRSGIRCTETAGESAYAALGIGQFCRPGQFEDLYDAWLELPLIVLAGLR